MVLCVVFGCSKRSGRDKDVRFFRIPKVIRNRGPTRLQLSQRRRTGFLTTISRSGMTEKILSNDRICSKHFISGQPAALEDETNPDWLPSLNLGHSKVSEKHSRIAEARWARKKARDEARVSNATQLDFVSSPPDSDSGLLNQDASIQTDLTMNMVNG